MDKKIKKIIVITAYPFNQRDYDRFGIECFRTSGFEVEIWDISTYLHKNFIDQLILEETVHFKDLRIFKEKYEIINAISSLDKCCIIICLIEYSLRTLFIFRAISKKQIPYCTLNMASFPSPYPVQDSFISRIIFTLKKVDLSKINEQLQHILNKILLNYYFLFGIAPASIRILGGEKSTGILSYPANNSTIQLWTHMPDYDIYLQDKTELNDSCKNTGVFLDEYLPLHPDYLTLGFEFPIAPDVYYSKICNFFKTLEKNMDTEIVIAAHPRSDYDKLPDYFCGRTIIKGKTAQLVKESSFVIAHDSTSINFAILYRKPIVFITTDDLQKLISGPCAFGLFIPAIASALGKIPLNIDHTSGFNRDKEMEINEEAYLRYRNNYIKKTGSPEKPLWEIFCSYLQ